MDGKRLTRFALPSIGDVLFLSIFVRTLTLGSDLLNDGDTGWHIVTGRLILDTGRIPRADIFSYTAQGADWVTHEWLAEVVFGALYKLSGLNGIILLSAALAALTFFMLYRRMVALGAPPLLSVALTAAGASVSAHHWLARPHMFSLVLTLVFFCVLDDYAKDKRDRLWILPVLMLAWVNLHAGFFLGLVMVVLYAASELPAIIASAGSVSRLKKLSLTASGVLLASFANPSGPAILWFPFHLTGRSFIMDNVQEWASTDFHVERGFGLLLLLVVSMLVFARRRPGTGELLLLLGVTHMSLVSVRFVPLFVVVALPVCASLFGGVIERLGDILSDNNPAAAVMRWMSGISGRLSEMESRLKGHLWVYVALVACATVSLNSGNAWGQRVFDYSHDPGRFPVAAMDFAMKNGINGRVFNRDGWGGYVTYRGYPEYLVFIDGRYDMYSVEHYKDYLTVARPKPGFTEILDRHGVDWVLFTAGAPVNRLLLTEGWRLVYSDDVAELLVKDIPRYSGVIQKYASGDEPK